MHQTVIYERNKAAAVSKWKSGWRAVPEYVYVIIEDDGTARTYEYGGNNDRRMQIYKNMDHLARTIASATEDNVYSLLTYVETDYDNPWKYWEDKTIPVRYDPEVLGTVKAKKVRDCDLWQKHGNLILTDHYYKEQEIMKPFVKSKARTPGVRHLHNIPVPF